MRHMGYDRSDLAEPMHRRDVDLGVRRVVPCRVDVGDHVAGGETCSATMVNAHPIGCSREKLAPVETGITSCDDGPGVRVGGGFAGEVPGVELREGFVEVFEVVRNARYDPLLRVDLDDVEGIVLNRIRIAAGGANTCEDETLTADCDGAHHRYGEADIGGRLQIFDHNISTMLILGSHDPSLIDSRIVVGHELGQGIPVPGRKMRPFVFEYARRRVLQSPRRLAEFLKMCDGGVEVLLVEKFDAADQIAVERENRVLPPFGLEAVLRGAMRRLGDDVSEVAQAMHDLEVHIYVRRV